VARESDDATADPVDEPLACEVAPPVDGLGAAALDVLATGPVAPPDELAAAPGIGLVCGAFTPFVAVLFVPDPLVAAVLVAAPLVAGPFVPEAFVAA
jgi:hypothetical protein